MTCFPVIILEYSTGLYSSSEMCNYHLKRTKPEPKNKNVDFFNFGTYFDAFKKYEFHANQANYYKEQLRDGKDRLQFLIQNKEDILEANLKFENGNCRLKKQLEQFVIMKGRFKELSNIRDKLKGILSSKTRLVEQLSKTIANEEDEEFQNNKDTSRLIIFSRAARVNTFLQLLIVFCRRNCSRLFSFPNKEINQTAFLCWRLISEQQARNCNNALYGQQYLPLFVSSLRNSTEVPNSN